MLGLLRRAPAPAGRARKRVRLRLEGLEYRDQPSGLGGPDDPPFAAYGDAQTNQAPHIEVYVEEVAIGLILVTGKVTDDQDPAGLIVRLGGIPAAIGNPVVVQADGTFSILLSVQTNGNDIGDLTAQTTDAQGLDSNVDWASVHPTPPGGN